MMLEMARMQVQIDQLLAAQLQVAPKPNYVLPTAVPGTGVFMGTQDTHPRATGTATPQAPQAPVVHYVHPPVAPSEKKRCGGGKHAWGVMVPGVLCDRPEFNRIYGPKADIQWNKATATRSAEEFDAAACTAATPLPAIKVGSATPVTPPTAKAVKTATAAYVAGLGGKGMHPQGKGGASGTLGKGSETATCKTRMCKFVSQKPYQCRNGNSCAFAHNMNELRSTIQQRDSWNVPPPQTLQNWAQPRQGERVPPLPTGGWVPPTVAQWVGPALQGAEQMGGKAPVKCHFYGTAKGCQRGDKCPYLHNYGQATAKKCGKGQIEGRVGKGKGGKGKADDGRRNEVEMRNERRPVAAPGYKRGIRWLTKEQVIEQHGPTDGPDLWNRSGGIMHRLQIPRGPSGQGMVARDKKWTELGVALVEAGIVADSPQKRKEGSEMAKSEDPSGEAADALKSGPKQGQTTPENVQLVAAHVKSKQDATFLGLIRTQMRTLAKDAGTSAVPYIHLESQKGMLHVEVAARPKHAAELVRLLGKKEDSRVQGFVLGGYKPGMAQSRILKPPSTVLGERDSNHKPERGGTAQDDQHAKLLEENQKLRAQLLQALQAQDEKRDGLGIYMQKEKYSAKDDLRAKLLEENQKLLQALQAQDDKRDGLGVDTQEKNGCVLRGNNHGIANYVENSRWPTWDDMDNETRQMQEELGEENGEG
eukprot:gene252-1824_t